MTADSLVHVLELVGARAAMAGGFEAGGRWAIRFPPPKQIKLFTMARGDAWLRLEGDEPVRLCQGDAFLLTAARSFDVASDLDVPAVDATQLFADASCKLRRVGTGDEVLFLGGHVQFESMQADLLVDSLPDSWHLHAGMPQARNLSWLIERLADEYREEKLGTAFATSQLAQMMLLEVLRSYVTRADATVSARLKVIGDARLSAALTEMHAQPARAWQLDELARIAGMSRTAFAVHFKAVAGVAPLAYLTEWRMRLARRRLERTDTSFAELAASLGYGSESAFSTAFKRETGISPKFFRARARGGPEPPEPSV